MLEKRIAVASCFGSLAETPPPLWILQRCTEMVFVSLMPKLWGKASFYRVDLYHAFTIDGDRVEKYFI